jgi:hypothetical protein
MADMRDWHIEYPSGASLTLHGDLVLLKDAETSFAPAILSGGESAYLLDPRAVISDAATGEIKYTPRTTDRHAPWVAEWLKEHPEWSR